MNEENIEKTETTDAKQEIVEQKETIENVSSNENVQQPVQTENKKTKYRFQIEIFDKISVGNPPYDKIQLQKVHYDQPVIIEAACKQDLVDFENKLALCQQTFKIVKKLDEVVENAIPNKNANVTQSFQNNNQTKNETTVKSKPKYYKVGDVEIKEDNGKIYQKQWLKLTEHEMQNFRIINDKNNAIVNLKDKHIEMKKWVLVESTTDETTTLEENLK